MKILGQTMTYAENTRQQSFVKNHFVLGLLFFFMAAWTFGWVFNHNMENWIIENLLVIIFLLVLAFTYPRFQFSNFSYFLFTLYLLLHCYGAYYAYTDNAFGAWLQQRFHLWRNPYDRIVHFSFGFLIAYPAYDLLLNRFKIKPGRAMFYAAELMFSLGTSFEMVEWAVASCTDSATGDTYVATQGDVWDAHKDIILALLGASITMSLLYLSKKRNGVVG